MTFKVDSFIKARHICEALGGISRRTLYELIRRGEYPPPDRKARKLGEPDLWRASTATRGVERYGRGEGTSSRARARQSSRG